MRLRFSLLVVVTILLGLWGYFRWLDDRLIVDPVGPEVRVLPYEKYSFENLAKRGGVASKIEVVGNKFYFQSEGRRISGEINFPARSDLAGVIVMARGYVDKEVYKTGIGTHNAAREYAKNGYITLAPDFSGYGESDPEPTSPPASLGSRLVKPVEILDLLASLGSLPGADLQKVYLWGHSNGGQIMLSVAEILGKIDLQGQALKVRGVTLWAPVSKPFPYNILYYTDDASDSGKWLRGEIANFEKDYDVFKYSIDRYISAIKMPLQIHQGGLDEAVPKEWSDDLVKALREEEKEVKYFTYPASDHNMKPASTSSSLGGPTWDSVVARDLEFFAEN